MIVTESDFICDVNSDSDGQCMCLSLRGIPFVMVNMTVTSHCQNYHQRGNHSQ